MRLCTRKRDMAARPQTKTPSWRLSPRIRQQRPGPARERFSGTPSGGNRSARKPSAAIVAIPAILAPGQGVSVMEIPSAVGSPPPPLRFLRFCDSGCDDPAEHGSEKWRKPLTAPPRLALLQQVVLRPEEWTPRGRFCFQSPGPLGVGVGSLVGRSSKRGRYPFASYSRRRISNSLPSE